MSASFFTTWTVLPFQDNFFKEFFVSTADNLRLRNLENSINVKQTFPKD